MIYVFSMIGMFIFILLNVIAIIYCEKGLKTVEDRRVFRGVMAPVCHVISVVYAVIVLLTAFVVEG